MSMRYLGGFISATNNPLLQPSAPSIGTVTAGSQFASVPFTAPEFGSPTSYTVVSTPGNIIATGTLSPIIVTGLTNGTAYTFRVFANNQYGPSAASAASNSVTPLFVNPTSINVLVVAGGGAGGRSIGGGGGAGGLVYQTGRSINVNTTYTVTIGAGGTGDGTGTNSVFDTITANGGGSGGHWYYVNPSSGGSGGAMGGRDASGTGASATQGNSGGGTGYGFAGGNMGNRSGDPIYPGGGGGAGGVGGNGVSAGPSGNGGIGREYSIAGTATYYAGGGGGGVYSNSRFGTGGLGGGGNGSASGTGQNGSANTGGGGGGAQYENSFSAGGSGVVIIAYGADKADAGTVTGTYTKTSAGGNTIYTFTGSGSIRWTSS